MSTYEQLDPNSGDYIVVNGRPVDDGTLNTPSYIRIMAPRLGTNPDGTPGGWMYAPDPSWGSSFYQYKKRHAPSDDPALLSEASRCLQPLITDGRAASVTPTEIQSGRDNFQMSIDVEQANGQEVSLTFTPITN